MQVFRLLRNRDHSGVSGTGYVAEGWLTSYGEVFLRWYGTGFSFFHSMSDMLKVHGYGGDTKVEIIWSEDVSIKKEKGYDKPVQRTGVQKIRGD